MSSLGGPATPDLERRWWRSLVSDIFHEIAGETRFQDFFDDLYHHFGHASNWRVFPEVRDTLHKMKAAGFTMGIVSNWDSRLLTLCREMQLEPYFDFILISAVVGHSKPGARIFHDAVKLAKCQRHQAIHVGDSYQDDYQAALDAGIGAIHLDRTGKPDANISRISNLKELVACVRFQ